MLFLVFRSLRLLLRTLIVLLLLAFACQSNGADTGNGDDKRINWLLIPFPIHSPETGWALTLSAIVSGQIGTAPASSAIVSLAWSEKDQKSFFFAPAINIEDTWRISGRLALEDWPTQYYGLGNDTRTQDEELFDARNAAVEIDARRRIAANVWLGPHLVWREREVRAIEIGGSLDRDAPIGVDGGTIAGLGVTAAYDSRDNFDAPARGQYLAASLTVLGGKLGSDYAFRRFAVDARQFVPLRHGRVLAFHQYAETNRGRVPFQELARLGDSAPPVLLRGHMTGRFRDRDLAVAQAELRFPIRARFSGVAFASVGDVAPRLEDLSVSELKWTGGVGLRFRAMANERINLRLDVGIGKDETGIYFSIREAF